MKKKILLILLFLTYFVILVHQIPDYGLTWDEPLQYSSGIAYLNFFKGKPLSVGNISNVANYGPFIDILSTYSYVLLTKMLNVVDAITAHRIPVALLSTLTIIAVYFFALKYFGEVVAIISTVLLAFYPRYFAHSHFNVKDIPMAGLYTITLFLFYEATIKKNIYFSLISGGVLGLALATKINAVFIPVTLIIWWALFLNKNILRRWDLILSLIFAPLVTILVWPWLWRDLINKLIGILTTFSTVGKGFSVFYFGKVYTSGVNVPWHYPLGYLLVVTPLLTLILAITGLIVSLKQYKKPVCSFLLIWFVVAILKISFSGMVYDGIRQFFEIVPVLSLFAGIGAWLFLRLIFTFVKVDIKKLKILLVLLILLLYVPTINSIVRLHPFESSYYNSLIGGTKGAVGKFRVSYWGEPIKRGAEWLNSHVKLNTIVYVMEAPHIAKYYLRPDIKIGSKAGEFILTLKTIPEYAPIKTFFADGVPILNIYKGTASLEPEYYYNISESFDLFYNQEIRK